jgi:hypothetical protein
MRWISREVGAMCYELGFHVQLAGSLLPATLRCATRQDRREGNNQDICK